MVGFLISNLKVGKKQFKHFDGCSYSVVDGVEIYHSPSEKFKNDKVFFEDEKYFILLDGLVLNAKELQNNLKKTSMAEVCEALLDEKGACFHEDFIGNYAGAVYFKREKKS